MLAGKTNLLLGLKTMHDIVIRSAGDLGQLPVVPFLFDPECRNQPTSFEVTCVTGGVRYQYGFSATKEEVVEEWLLRVAQRENAGLVREKQHHIRRSPLAVWWKANGGQGDLEKSHP